MLCRFLMFNYTEYNSNDVSLVSVILVIATTNGRTPKLKVYETFTRTSYVRSV